MHVALKDAPVTVRLKNCLSDAICTDWFTGKAGIRTHDGWKEAKDFNIYELSHMPDSWFLAIPNFGRVTLKELRELIKYQPIITGKNPTKEELGMALDEFVENETSNPEYACSIANSLMATLWCIAFEGEKAGE